MAPKSLQKLIQNHLKINADFCMRFGSEKVSKMAPKRGSIKRSISSLRPLKLEKTRCFSIPMPKILEKTRYFCMSDPTGPLKASKYGFCSKNHRNMCPTRPPNTRKCNISPGLYRKHTQHYAFLIHADTIWHSTNNP